MSEDSQEELLKDFSVYDTAVDIVSSWEASMNYIYGSEFPDFYFDRFPELETDGVSVTPDFTVFFNESYSLICEVKRTFPNDRKAIISELKQIQSYDSQLGLKNGSGNYVVPETCDIAVIIEGSSAPQIGTRLQRLIVEEEECRFEKNPVLLRYQFNQDAMKSRYEFQRVTQLDFEFRDNEMEAEDTLSEMIGEEGDYGTLSGYPMHFHSFKVRKPLCNDAPPGPYIATFLWHKIFPRYLNKEKYEIWQATDGQKAIPIDLTVDELTWKVNDYMQDGSARNIWVRRGLDFLCGADLAKDEGGGDYEIRFMGLVQDVGESSMQDGMQELEQTRELARTFIQRYCEKSESGEEPEIADYEEVEADEYTEQADFDDYI